MKIKFPDPKHIEHELRLLKNRWKGSGQTDTSLTNIFDKELEKLRNGNISKICRSTSVQNIFLYRLTELRDESEELLNLVVQSISLNHYNQLPVLIDGLLKIGRQNLLKTQEFRVKYEGLLKNVDNQIEKFWEVNISEITSNGNNFHIQLPDHMGSDLESSLKLIEYRFMIKRDHILYNQIFGELLIEQPPKEIELNRSYLNRLKNLFSKDPELGKRFLNAKLEQLRQINDNDFVRLWRMKVIEPTWGEPFKNKFWTSININQELLDWYRSLIILESIEDLLPSDANVDRREFWTAYASKMSDLPEALGPAKGFLLKLKSGHKSVYVVEFNKVGRAFFFDGEIFERVVEGNQNWKHESQNYFKPIGQRNEIKDYVVLHEAILGALTHWRNHSRRSRWDYTWQDEFEDLLYKLGISLIS